MPQSGFHELLNFKPKKELEKNFQFIQKELLPYSSDKLILWHEQNIYKGEWFIKPLLLHDIVFASKEVMAMQTIKLLISLNCVQACISILKPNTKVFSHSDEIFDDVLLSKKTYRLQLGLSIPKGCEITVNNSDNIAETKNWKNGKVIAFDSSMLHSAINPTDKNRVVLIADFIKERCSIFENELEKLKKYYLGLYQIAT